VERDRGDRVRPIPDKVFGSDRELLERFAAVLRAMDRRGASHEVSTRCGRIERDPPGLDLRAESSTASTSHPVEALVQRVRGRNPLAVRSSDESHARDDVAGVGVDAESLDEHVNRVEAHRAHEGLASVRATPHAVADRPDEDREVLRHLTPRAARRAVAAPLLPTE
jgi:hypothetical protein